MDGGGKVGGEGLGMCHVLELERSGRCGFLGVPELGEGVGRGVVKDWVVIGRGT